jgi:glycosyltransferase involved in cell wall biosynthesis
MRILFFSYFFSPSVGGIETVSKALALEFKERGHEVKVVTTTVSDDPFNDLGLEVFRNPLPVHLVGLVKWCEVFFHNNIGLKCLWPLLIFRRPWVVATHTWICRPDGTRRFQDRLKIRLLGWASNIYISQAIARHVGVPGRIIPNAYDETIFREPDSNRWENTPKLLFVGRLVSDKGCALLLEALALLRSRGMSLQLTIVGSGPEEASLHSLVQNLGLEAWVAFRGTLQGKDLVAEMGRHAILVVPSLWEEPFGLVALEGIACGCVVVGSAGGGLSEAIGECGRTFPNGDAGQLANTLAELLEHPERMTEFREAAAAHLARHSLEVVAGAYLEELSRSLPATHKI